MSKRTWEARADAIKEKCSNDLAKLAGMRLAFLRTWFVKEYPGHSLYILFGMGSEAWTLDGYRLEVGAGVPGYADEVRLYSTNKMSYRVLTGAFAERFTTALIDVLEICDGYEAACPDDVEVKA